MALPRSLSLAGSSRFPPACLPPISFLDEKGWAVPLHLPHFPFYADGHCTHIAYNPTPQDPQPPRLTFFPLFSFMNFLIGPIPKNVLQLTLVLLTLPCRCLSFPCLLRRIAIKSFVTEYNIPRYITRWDAKIQEHKITKSHGTPYLLYRRGSVVENAGTPVARRVRPL